MGVQVIRPDQRVFFVGNDAIEVYHGKSGAAAAGNGLLNNLIAYWPNMASTYAGYGLALSDSVV